MSMYLTLSRILRNIRLTQYLERSIEKRKLIILGSCLKAVAQVTIESDRMIS